MTRRRETTRRVDDASIVCAGVVHLYQGEDPPVVALRNVDLYVASGEMVGIVGPSGSGKSTLLSLLAGLFRPTAGTVVVAGNDMGRLDNRSLDRLRATELSILLQEPLRNLLPYGTGAENIAFAQRGARRRRGTLPWSIADVIEIFGLGPAADTPVYELSAGEQQRVAMASAMATSPSVLLADEPTNQLDRSARDRVLETLHRVHRSSGTTILVVTHDITVAEALPRSLTISEGSISSEGRGARSFSVMGHDGSVHLPSEVTAIYPAGTLFEVSLHPSTVELHPQGEDEP